MLRTLYSSEYYSSIEEATKCFFASSVEIRTLNKDVLDSEWTVCEFMWRLHPETVTPGEEPPVYSVVVHSGWSAPDNRWEWYGIPEFNVP